MMATNYNFFLQVLSGLPCHWTAEVLHTRLLLHRAPGLCFNSKHLKYSYEWSDAIFQVDVILIASQALGPADGSHYIINYFGAGLNSFSECVNDVCFRLAMPFKTHSKRNHYFAAFKADQSNTHLSLPIAMKVSEMTDVKSASDAALGPDLIPHRSHRHKQRNCND